MIAAPSAAMSLPASAAASGAGKAPAVGEAVGRDVDDAHHLRLVEPDRARAELQRRPRAGQRRPVRRHGVVEPALDPFDRHQFARDPPTAFDAQQFDAREPVQPARKPRDLAVMPERRIDEAGRADAASRMAYAL